MSDRPPRLSWWHRRTLRTRLTVVATAALAVAVLAGAVLFAVAVRLGLQAAADDTLAARAESVAVLVGRDALPSTLPVPADGAALVQVLGPEGGVLAASADASRAVVLLSPREVAQGLASGEPFTVAGDRTGSGAGLRALVRPASGGRAVVAAVPVAVLDDPLQVVRVALLAGVPLLLAAAAGAVWLTVRSALRPVDELRAGAAAVRGADAARRLPVPTAVDEVHALATTLNDMLDRLEDAGRRQRDFVADAAHELRSPLAALRTTVEVELAHPQPDWPAVAPTLLADVERLQRLVDDLLLLARVDGSDVAPSAPARETDAARLVARAAEEAAAGRAGLLRLDLEPIVTTLAAEVLDRVTRNLVANAVRYARSAVDVSLRRDGEVLLLRVDDDGPGIPAADRERVFERFTRLDDARARDAGGSGLGLAIVHDLVGGAGGDVRLSASVTGGVRVDVELPIPSSTVR